jgi:H+-translocating NAD(P) transhydrogenase subunit alpha
VHIGVPLETQTGETRVAATPETIKKLIGQGHKVTVQSGAGINASVIDSTLMKPPAQPLAVPATRWAPS